jgi:aminopeptidase N
MKKLLIVLFILANLSTSKSLAQVTIEPDVTKYTININSINIASSSIAAYTQVDFKVDSTNVSYIKLSLFKLLIDSIQQNAINLSFTYNDTTITVQLLSTLNAGDSSSVTVFYHGNPKQDPSGWGGFYFSGTYAFNMGVGFDSDPHNLGKIWFPCVDNFTDRAFYEFNVITPSTSKAFCNGILTAQTLLPNGNIKWTWEMNDRIPTYLASISVAPYYTWKRNYSGIPVEIACAPTDSNLVAATYINLPTILNKYISAYGPYPFDKVGFCLIPFGSGAMEHATSIHIGRTFINGTLSYETLWAHELAHMWWGDNVTCETAGDMWLNEGFASFNEAFVTQQLYGETAYRNWNRSNHRSVLQFAHIKDGGYLPMQNIPMNHTYGTTVYNKGASVAHTLRYYMTDSLFFNGCKDYMLQLKDSSANSYDLRDILTTSSGINMNAFFDDWIFTPGFPHFSIDSVVIVNGPPAIYNYTVYTRQKSKGNNHIYQMLVDLNFSDGIIDTTLRVLIDQPTNSFQFQLPNYLPWVSVDRFDKMADAIIDNEKVITTTGGNTFSETNVTLTVLNAGTGTNSVRIEHNFVAADDFKSNPGIKVSDYHYWKVDGIFSNGFLSKAVFLYNGGTSLSTGYLDNTLITSVEDSLVILYRPNSGSEWQIVPGFTLNKSGSSTDKIGNIVIDTLKKGEYTFGYYSALAGLNQASNTSRELLKVYPNPSSDTFTISIPQFENKRFMICIYDIKGRNVYNKNVYGKESFTWNPGLLSNGEYIIKLYDNKEVISSTKIIYNK